MLNTVNLNWDFNPFIKADYANASSCTNSPTFMMSMVAFQNHIVLKIPKYTKYGGTTHKLITLSWGANLESKLLL